MSLGNFNIGHNLKCLTFYFFRQKYDFFFKLKKSKSPAVIPSNPYNAGFKNLTYSLRLSLVLIIKKTSYNCFQNLFNSPFDEGFTVPAVLRGASVIAGLTRNPLCRGF
jgi:hypothetical protein